MNADGWRDRTRVEAARVGVAAARQRLAGIPFCEGCHEHVAALATETLCIDCADEETP